MEIPLLDDDARQLLRDLAFVEGPAVWAEFAHHEPELNQPSNFSVEKLHFPYKERDVEANDLHNSVLVLESILLGFRDQGRRQQYKAIYLYCALLYIIAESYFPSATSLRRETITGIQSIISDANMKLGSASIAGVKALLSRAISGKGQRFGLRH